MAKHTITVNLTEQEEKFIEWLREENVYGAYGEKKLTKRELLSRMFYFTLRHDMDIYGEEFNDN